MKKRVAIFGSTGSIGTQTLQVIEEKKEELSVELLTANNNYQLLIKQALLYNPNVVVIANKNHYSLVSDALNNTQIKVYAGSEALCQVAQMDTIDIIMMGIVGIAALKPLMAAIAQSKTIALANKESLVVAGDIIRDEVIKNKANIIPVDSEHSAIFQCLMGEQHNEIDKIILTASGGPFLDYSYDQLLKVTPNDALAHPNWNMGNRVSIDSASLMNKGLEAIEAKWLFDVSPSQIEVVIHPQSIIHSMVSFTDGSMKALLSYHDMRIPIQFALTYPMRQKNSYKKLDLTEMNTLTFRKPDVKNFRNLALAFNALETGGNLPCVVNASNDVVVSAFISGKIGFNDMPTIIEKCINSIDFTAKSTIGDIIDYDKVTRIKARELINH